MTDSIKNNALDSLAKGHFMFERLLESRTITIFSGINAQVAEQVTEQLLVLETADHSKPIRVLLNSPGGEVNSGFSIYDIMRFIQPEIQIVCTGLCASIATIILMGADKENRISLPNARFLIHQPLIRGGIQGQATDIQIHAEEIVKTREKINRVLAEETGQNLDRVTNDTDRDYWMNAKESLEYGLISKIVSSQNEL